MKFVNSLCALSVVAALFTAETVARETGPKVRSIVFKGLSRTEERVLRRELEFHEGEVLNESDVEESVRRISNLRIFRAVGYEVRPVSSAEVDVVFSLRERWTTIMIFQPGSAGGRNYLHLGAYDPHVFGRYLELGGSYLWQDGLSSGQVWFIDPRFLNRRLKFGVVGALERDTVGLYDSEAAGVSRVGGFSRITPLARAYLEYEVNPEFYLGAGLHAQMDRIHSQSLPPDSPDGLAARTGATVTGSLYADVGRVNYERDFLENGRATRLRFDTTLGVLGSEFGFQRVTLSHRDYWVGPWSSNFALRASVGHTTADVLQHRFFLGGVEDVRGYRYAQFNGQSFWRLNLEWRVPSIVSSWLILQHAVFADAASAADRPAGLFSVNPFESAGLGIRLMTPRVYSMSIRLDYAIPLDSRGDRGFVFGVRQYF